MYETGEQVTDVKDLSWYHPNSTRHIAESLLLQNGKDGAYLLRPSSKEGELAISVRCNDSVKHISITWDGDQYKFGMGAFSSFGDFVKHLRNQPLIAGESGVLTQLKYPYPRNVSEPGMYETVRIHAELGQNASLRRDHTNFSVASKEGYLTKRGEIRKVCLFQSWKTRWFVLVKNEFKYHKMKTDKEPIRVLDLAECTACTMDTSLGKENCFSLTFPKRTFYMYAATEEETLEWMKIIQWKLDHLKSKD